jgi:ankyrin repeat protein
MLLEASAVGNRDLVKAFLREGANPNTADRKGRTPLWHAAHWGHSAIIRDLVRAGAQLPDDVLMGPVQDSDISTIRFLIGRGANVNCAATFCRRFNKFPEKEILLTVAMQRVLLQRAIRADAASDPNDEAIPILLIKAGANVNGPATTHAIQGFIATTLGFASQQGLVKTVRVMLAAGADPNQRDTWGGTPLLHATRRGHHQIIQLLLKAGAQPLPKGNIPPGPWHATRTKTGSR